MSAGSSRRKITQLKKEEAEKQCYKGVKHVGKDLKKNATEPTQQEISYTVLRY
ncbi:predicted protein [Histoplasma mississippiense (nom. inval.)]|uniref:predicted protein n=1 Tax=Ajellomyces capsulatus (strain NAm1 / WU24) TaxID=2059318 RepID=UPI000157C78A|nr:predicted protein [Histoplasma mississippiense (nom. inval.)]EDN08175.1 predicted protein [Histoplasma mississippiense (nom. inval.)]